MKSEMHIKSRREGEAASLAIDGAVAAVQPVVFKDVWSRSGSRYRVRSYVLLGVNVLLFAGVGSFAYWLRTGVRLAPIQEGYWDELQRMFWSVPIGGRSYGGASLGSLLLNPISVQEVPMQIPILGLLMAALIAIPILVSLLYRFWSSVPFVAVVGTLAVMPWLALTLLLSCVLSASRPFRSRYRFVSALVGLVPVVVYLALAWSGTTDAIAGRIDPIDRVKFVAPWVMALVAATIVFAFVLAIAKLVDYRPGAITPLLAVMFGLPVALFEFHVGRDELYYRLLERRNESHFADRDASADLHGAVREEWLRDSDPRHTAASIRAQVETRWLFGLTSDMRPHRSALSRYQAELTADCDHFLRSFPDSRYVLNVLYIRATALDMRVDPQAFRQTKWIRFHADFPGPASRETWRLLAQRGADTIPGGVAQLRLAQLDAREGYVDRAMDRLNGWVDRWGRSSSAEKGGAQAEDENRQVWARQRPERSLHIALDGIRIEVHRLRELLSANRDPLYGYDPLSGPRVARSGLTYGLLDLEPRHEQYVANLQRLRAAYPNCQIQDNIDLELAKSADSLDVKIERLRVLVTAYADGDAVPEALYHLAAAYRARDQVSEGDEVMMRLMRDHPESLWSDQASRLRRLRESVADSNGNDMLEDMIKNGSRTHGP